MPALPALEVGFDIVRLRSGVRGRPVLYEHEAYQPKVRPFLKWAGGKQWLVPIATAFLPTGFGGRYYEPFLGGGALFFALAPRRATLSDTNGELIVSYTALRDDPDGVISKLRSYPYDRAFFHSLRERRPKRPNMRAARLIYLNKTAFNGLYRVSASGHFNVPFGEYTRPTICNAQRLRAAAGALKDISLFARPFHNVIARARKGDVVYLDPPYITGHTNNGFLKYNAKLFAWQDQIKLAERSHALSRRGVRVVISGPDHSAIVGLYTGFYCYRVQRRSAIGGGIPYRGQVSELLLTSFPLYDIESPRLT